MAFPISPADGDSYTDPTTNRKFVYSSANSLWQLRGRSELADYTSLTGTIATPSSGDSLIAAASGTEYQPASQVSNNFQARRDGAFFQYSWPGNVDYPSGALAKINGDSDMAIHVSSSPRTASGTMATNYSSSTPGSSGSTLTFNPGEGFHFSFTVPEPITSGQGISFYFYNTVANADFPTLRLYLTCALIKGREIDQTTLDNVLSLQTGGRVLSLGNTEIYQYSGLSFSMVNYYNFASQVNRGDTLTCIVFVRTNSTATQPLVIDDWTGIAPNSTNVWQQVDTVIPTPLTYPAGFNPLTDLSTTGDLPLYARFSTSYDQGRDYRKPPTSLYDFYERRRNQVSDDQNMEILAAPVTPSQSQFLTDKYTIYNSTTGALNYWDSGTSSWNAI